MSQAAQPEQHRVETLPTASLGEYGADADTCDPIIEVHDLRMSYGPIKAVAGIDLNIHAGEVFAFLDPNGAGKTTTVEILEGFRRRTGGDVRVLGADPAHAHSDWRARIGVVLQESEPEPELTAQECVDSYASYYARPRSKWCLSASTVHTDRAQRTRAQLLWPLRCRGAPRRRDQPAGLSSPARSHLGPSGVSGQLAQYLIGDAPYPSELRADAPSSRVTGADVDRALR